jgi:hypothetical protein
VNRQSVTWMVFVFFSLFWLIIGLWTLTRMNTRAPTLTPQRHKSRAQTLELWAPAYRSLPWSGHRGDRSHFPCSLRPSRRRLHVAVSVDARETRRR